MMWLIKWLLAGIPMAFLASAGTLHVSHELMIKKYELTPANLLINYLELKNDYLLNASEQYDIQPDKVDLEYHDTQFWGQDVALQPNEIDIAYHDLAMGFSADQRALQLIPLMIGYWLALGLGGVLFYGINIRSTSAQ